MLGQTLSHYEIVEKLGSGGMGDVYRATDLELKRDVAIKVLRGELATDPERLRRFEQEARSASALNHPNIITVHEIGKVDSTPFIVMELVDGVTLRELLSEGPLAAKKMIPLAAQIAEGLAKAHSAGIVHRDLKPENIMVTGDGYVKILDFGLAKLVASDTDSEAATIEKGGTTPGVVMGTAGYMSPEQAKGQPVDYRADQFAFGAILYEMATGKRAFQRDTAVETLSAILKEEPDSLSHLKPDLPAHLQVMVERCLAKAPEDRYESSRNLARDLKSIGEPSGVSAETSRRLPRRLAISGGLIALLALAVGLFVSDFLDDAGPGPVESLAVLPLENLSGDPEQEYFADGMTEALTAELGKISALRVISRTSVMRYKETRKPLSEIAGELNVDAVVEGSVLRSGDRVRITTQLVQAAPERHLWAESYERDLRDILSLQGEVARAVAHEIQVTLTPQEEALLSSARPVNPDAHEAYLKGRFYVRRPWEIDKAFEYFNLAIELDPDYAPAHASLSLYHTYRAWLGLIPPIEAMPQAKEAALEAINLDETLSDAHYTLGYVYMNWDWDWQAARREFRRAIALNPGNAEAHLHYGVYLTLVGRVAEGLGEIERARKLDPLSPSFTFWAAQSSFFLRQYDQAIEQYETTLELEPDYALAHWYLFRTYWQKESYDEAFAALSKMRALSAQFFEFPEQFDVELDLGHKPAILALARKFDEQSDAGYLPKGPIALFYVLGEEREKALQLLERAVEERESYLVYLKVFPEWDVLRNEPRFQDLVRRVNFPE